MTQFKQIWTEHRITNSRNSYIFKNYSFPINVYYITEIWNENLYMRLHKKAQSQYVYEEFIYEKNDFAEVCKN